MVANMTDGRAVIHSHLLPLGEQEAKPAGGH